MTIGGGNLLEKISSIDVNDAQQCEKELLEVWGYDQKEVDSHLKKRGIEKVQVKLHGSEKYDTLKDEGENEPEAVCNAYKKFIENREKYERE